MENVKPAEPIDLRALSTPPPPRNPGRRRCHSHPDGSGAFYRQQRPHQRYPPVYQRHQAKEARLDLASAGSILISPISLPSRIRPHSPLQLTEGVNKTQTRETVSSVKVGPIPGVCAAYDLSKDFPRRRLHQHL